MNSFNPQSLNPESLYLVFPDGTQLYLTRDHIDRVTDRFWKDPAILPENVKAAIDFQRCAACPMQADHQICDALRPILPLLDHIDKFTSFDPVQVVYAGSEADVFHIANTTTQTALSYISILSLIHYCQAGRKFRKYYFDIMPLTSPSGLASKLYLNIFWLHKGCREEIAQVIDQLSHGMLAVNQNLVKRLRLISNNDAFNNAFVNAHVATAILSLGIEKQLQLAIERFEKGV